MPFDIGKPKIAGEYFRRLQHLVIQSQLPSSGSLQLFLADKIEQLDKMRPLGPDGKHGDRHTAECGCEDLIRCENCNDVIVWTHNIFNRYDWYHVTNGVRPCHPTVTYAKPKEPSNASRDGSTKLSM